MKALVLLVAALCGALPNRWIGPALPLIWVLERLLTPQLEVAITLGPVGVTPTDILLAVLTAKLLVALVLRKELVLDSPLYIALAAYVAVNFVATVAAGLKFGPAAFFPSLTSLARFTFETLLIVIVAQSVQTVARAKRFLLCLLGTLALLAFIQFVNAFGVSHGITIGEVQGLERGEARYFGPIGDSIGIVLLLGYLFALCAASLTGAALFLGGILLTGGLGATVATGVATFLFLVFGLRTAVVRDLAQRRLWLLPVLVLVVGAAVVFLASSLGGTLLDRVTTGAYMESAEQRGASSKLAARMILDNPLLGVGYMGFERALPKYGGDAYFDLQHPDGGTANANNQILQALTDSGVFGLIAFGALMICAGRLFLRVSARSEDRFITIYYLAVFLWLLTQVFGNLGAVWFIPASYSTRLLWVSTGVAVALARLMPAAQPATAPRGRAPTEPQLQPA